MTKKQKLYFVFINAFIFITTFIAVPLTLIIGSRSTRLDGITEFAPWQHIVTFTILSNIFLGLIAFVAFILGLKSIHNSKTIKPTFLTWYLTASSAAMVTCFTVLLFLAPMRAANGKNYFDMILETMFFLHFFNPILSAVAFIFFTGSHKLSKRAKIIATLPIIIYAVPYLINVVFLHIWPDFYGITFGGNYFITPIVFVVFWVLIFTVASLLVFFRNKTSHKALS